MKADAYWMSALDLEEIVDEELLWTVSVAVVLVRCCLAV